VRLNSDQDPDNDHAPIGAPTASIAPPKDQVVDGGFLELVRYGVRRADDRPSSAACPSWTTPAGPTSTASATTSSSRASTGVPRLAALRRRRLWRGRQDRRQLRRRRPDASGPARPGLADLHRRARPLRTGLAGLNGKPDAAAVKKIRDRYVKAMELFANEGLLIPEQVWDGIGAQSARLHARRGHGLGHPLAWSHAEYVKLLRSVSDGQVWDTYAPVKARFSR
jgi:glucoamylase